MQNRLRIKCFLLGLLLLSPGGFAQEEDSGWGKQDSTIPDTLRRPDKSEALRYPKDLVIGDLGQGESPLEAYLFARELLSALAQGNIESPIISQNSFILNESLLDELKSIMPRAFHIGGGRIETDGSVSFMLRFLGSEESIAGELYLRRAELQTENSENEKWVLDDLVLEEKRTMTEIKDSYRYDFSPYERFF